MMTPHLISIRWPVIYIGTSGRDEMRANRAEGLAEYLKAVWIERDKAQHHDPRIRPTWTWPILSADEILRRDAGRVNVTKLPISIRKAGGE